MSGQMGHICQGKYEGRKGINVSEQRGSSLCQGRWAICVRAKGFKYKYEAEIAYLCQVKGNLVCIMAELPYLCQGK